MKTINKKSYAPIHQKASIKSALPKLSINQQLIAASVLSTLHQKIFKKEMDGRNLSIDVEIFPFLKVFRWDQKKVHFILKQNVKQVLKELQYEKILDKGWELTQCFQKFSYYPKRNKKPILKAIITNSFFRDLEENPHFYQFKLKTLAKFKNKYTLFFYNHFLEKLAKKTVIKHKDDIFWLKTKLNLTTRYERKYNFISRIIKPVTKEMNLFTELKLSFKNEENFLVWTIIKDSDSVAKSKILSQF